MRFLKSYLLWPWLGILGILSGSLGASWGLAQPSCQFYSGEKTLAALQERQAVLVNGDIDPCELANIYYQLAKITSSPQATVVKNHYLEQCIESAERAIQQNSRTGTAYFLRGLCLGRQGESQGLWSSLKIISPFRENMEIAVKIAPGIDRGGPHRALGRLYYKLPGLLGGDLEESIYHLQQSIKFGPGYWENHYFLAASYFSWSRYAEAKNTLAQAMILSAQDPDQSDAPERQQNFEDLMDSINAQCPDLSCSMN